MVTPHQYESRKRYFKMIFFFLHLAIKSKAVLYLPQTQLGQVYCIKCVLTEGIG